MAGIKEKTVREAIAYRRSVRAYTDESLDDDKVKDCIQQATFAPTSSNLQLWEFYHVTDKEKCKEIAKACFNQGAAKTCLLYTSPSPRDATLSRMPSSA